MQARDTLSTQLTLRFERRLGRRGIVRDLANVDSFTIKQSVIQDKAASTKSRAAPGSKVVVSNLKVTLPASTAGLLRRWQTAPKTTTGYLELLHGAGKRWARFELADVQLVGVARAADGAVATLSVGRITLSR